MATSEAQKIYVTEGNTAVVQCPKCGTGKSIDVGKYRGRRKALRARCVCNCRFEVQLEFRRAYRKNINVAGHYVRFAPSRQSGKVTVKNLSRLGVGFTTLAVHDLREGDEVRVTFILDDAKRSKIEKDTVVKVVNDMFIGCEFTDLTQCDKVLGFYLMP